MADIIQELRKTVPFEVLFDTQTLDDYKRDASVFEITPEAIAFPKNSKDLKTLIDFINRNRKTNPELSLTPRGAGTCMSGGSLTDSIMVDMKYFNKIEILKNYANVGTGVFFRDLEKELKKLDLFYPPYPASRLICKIGGMIGNDAGGEKSLSYGKTNNFVQELRVVLRDGNEYIFKKIDKKELLKKCKLENFEGEFYRKIYKLLDNNFDLIEKSRPTVSKNSTGFNIWDVWDKKNFDITKLFTGSQGTLGIVTEAQLKVIPKLKHSGLLVLYLKDFENIPEIVQKVLENNPSSFESYDNNTLRLALKYFYGFSKNLRKSTFEVLKEFLPDFRYVLKNGIPKLILLVEFEDNDPHKIHEKLKKLNIDLLKFNNVKIKITKNEAEREKYWVIRRESFNLLRKKVSGMHAASFIDDTVVDPKFLPEFFPKIYKLLNESEILFTIAGHIGNGNFHIIPLMDLSSQNTREKIYELNEKIFDLVFSYKGSISGEHNDGLIRSPYLKKQYGEKIYDIFAQIKKVFDPDGIFNPHKKIGITKEFAKKYMINHKAP